MSKKRHHPYLKSFGMCRNQTAVQIDYLNIVYNSILPIHVCSPYKKQLTSIIRCNFKSNMKCAKKDIGLTYVHFDAYIDDNLKLSHNIIS